MIRKRGDEKNHPHPNLLPEGEGTQRIKQHPYFRRD